MQISFIKIIVIALFLLRSLTLGYTVQFTPLKIGNQWKYSYRSYAYYQGGFKVYDKLTISIQIDIIDSISISSATNYIASFTIKGVSKYLISNDSIISMPVDSLFFDTSCNSDSGLFRSYGDGSPLSLSSYFIAKNVDTSNTKADTTPYGGAGYKITKITILGDSIEYSENWRGDPFNRYDLDVIQNVGLIKKSHDDYDFGGYYLSLYSYNGNQITSINQYSHIYSKSSRKIVHLQFCKNAIFIKDNSNIYNLAGKIDNSNRIYSKYPTHLFYRE